MTAALPATGLADPTSGARVRMEAPELVAALHALRAHPVDAEWWARFALCLQCLCRAKTVSIVQRRKEDGAWYLLGESGQESEAEPVDLAALLGAAAGAALSRGFVTLPSQNGVIPVAARIAADDEQSEVLALLRIPARERAVVNELTLRAMLVADLPMRGNRLPAVSEAPTGAATSPAGSEDILSMLDLIARVMQERHFGAAALTLVNGIAAQFGCDQVVLGWEKNGYMRVCAISHLDRFEKRTENVQLLEAALEEAVDQRSNLSFPRAADDTSVLLAHGRVAQVLGYPYLQTELIAQGDAAPEVALLLADQDAPVDAARIHTLAVGMHLLLPWLTERHSQDKWLLARGWAALRARAGQWVGLEHVGQKLIGLLMTLGLLYTLVGTAPHRIEANAQLVTDSTLRLTAPFDGYLDEVLVSLGDEVEAGTLLATLDVQEIHLQESEIRADMRRFEAEADRARAMGQLAEVEIALSRLEQARARLERVTLYLAQSRLIAPFDSVVVEGERKDLVGMPVRQGDGLLRLARIEGLYASIRVPERNIQYVSPGATGQLRLLAEPDRDVPFTVVTVVPLAQAQGQQGSEFMVKVEIGDEPAPWWRPGMSGVAKVDAGDRQIAWLLTHRIVDFLRMKLWW